MWNNDQRECVKDENKSEKTYRATPTKMYDVGQATQYVMWSRLIFI